MIAEVYQDLVIELNAGKKAVIVTTLENDNHKATLFQNKVLLKEEGLGAVDSITNMDEAVFSNVKSASESGNLYFLEGLDKKKYLIEPYFPESRLIILGGGHIAKPLSQFGAKVGFSVTVVDDRPFFANKERFPEAENVICEDFKKCFDRLDLNMSAFVVIVTRGHRHDLVCLRQVLKHNTAYTGMIGSSRRVAGVRMQLLSEGYPKEKLDNVNAPIGLTIGAITPEEIAISIIAQVISFKRLRKQSRDCDVYNKVNWTEFDQEVLEELGKKNSSPRAIVTIISTKGSVPRKAGAKMIIWPDGRAMGSIGGGCSEGAVITAALDVIRNGGCKILDVDMTAEFAEDEGMVCGGVMQVVIEAYGE